MSRTKILRERAERNHHEGPLGAYVDNFSDWLAAQGYAVSTIDYFVRLVADLSRWLVRQGLGIRDLQRQAVGDFVQARDAAGCLRPGDAVMLDRLLGFLQTAGVIKLVCAPPIETASDHLCRRYAAYLVREQGLSQATLSNYLPPVRTFLFERFGSETIELTSLDAGAVTAFVLGQVRHLSPARAKLVVTALRSFLRFLFVEGAIATDLRCSVPTVPLWRMQGLPKALTPEQIQQVLAHCDRTTTVGKRDYAILMLLARLGLRAGEVVALRLDDLHWSESAMIIRGKGASCDKMPLTREVGEAIVDYLQHGRPACPSRDLFLRSKAPLRGFASSVAISTLVRRALERAELEPRSKGAHLFRHGLACSMLRQGATLEQIGEILRHRHPDTTALYAKVDLPRLRPLAPPWPGGAS